MDNLGEDVVMKFGLDSSLNYYLGNQATTTQGTDSTTTGSRRLETDTNTTDIAPRDGFTNIESVGALGEAIGISIAGGLSGNVDVVLVGIPGDAGKRSY